MSIIIFKLLFSFFIPRFILYQISVQNIPKNLKTIGSFYTKMTSLEEHKRKIREHLKELQDAIDEGIENKPITIGIHTSLCAVELLELFLHKKKLISTGKQVKHNWFERPKLGQKIIPLIERNLPVNFEDKEKIYALIYNIEEVRDALIYGKSSPFQTKQALESFLQLKELLKEKLKEEGEEIE